MVTISITLEDAIMWAKVNMKDDVARARRSGARRVKQLRANARLVAKLALVLPEGAELKIESMWGLEEPTVSFPRELLPKVREAVGRLHVDRKSLKDPEQGLLTVSLTAERFPGIEFRYDRPLVEGASCKIATQTSTYKTLVCTRE